MNVLENPLLERELNRINMNILEISYAKIDSRWRMQHVISPFIRLYYVQTGRPISATGKNPLLRTSVLPKLFCH